MCTAKPTRTQLDALTSGATTSKATVQQLRSRGWAHWGPVLRHPETGWLVGFTPLGMWVRGLLRMLAAWKAEAEAQEQRAELAERKLRRLERERRRDAA